MSLLKAAILSFTLIGLEGAFSSGFSSDALLLFWEYEGGGDSFFFGGCGLGFGLGLSHFEGDFLGGEGDCVV